MLHARKAPVDERVKRARESAPRFTYHEGWDRLTQADGEDIIRFWQREKALPGVKTRDKASARW